MKTGQEVVADPAAEKTLSSFDKALLRHGIERSALMHVLGFLGALVLAGLLSVVVITYRSSTLNRKARLSRDLYAATDVSSLTALLDEHPSGATAPLATLKLAGLQYAGGGYALAYATYTQFLESYPEHAFRDIAELGAIACRESQGMTQEALSNYAAFIEKHPRSFLAPEATLARARCCEQLGKLEDAKQLYEEFLVTYAGVGTMVERADEALATVNMKLRRQSGTL